MKKQTVTWTALPNGLSVNPERGAARLQLSVYVSIRLKSTQASSHLQLSEYPDFLDWPAKIADASFQVRFGNRPPVDAEAIQPPSEPAPSDLWASIFDEDTWVKPYEVQRQENERLQGRVVRSFSVKNVVSHVKAAYQTLATEIPTEPPRLEFQPQGPQLQNIQPFMQLMQDAAPDKQKEMQLQQRMDTQLRSKQFKAIANPALKATGAGQKKVQKQTPQTGKVNLPSQVSRQMVDFHQVKSFYGQIQTPGLRPPQVRVPIEFDPIDFHEIISSLGEYPQVMRRLGIVIDLEIPFQAFMKNASWVKIVPNWNPQMAATSDVTPRTRCSVTADDFKAVGGKNSGDIEDGQLKLGDETQFEVGQIDVDGAAIKTADTADTIKQEGEGNSKQASVPAMRSAGLWVAKVNRAHEFVNVQLPKVQLMNTKLQKIETNSLLQTPGIQKQNLGDARPTQGSKEEIDLYAEDLVRGYRIDVRDEEDGTWRSLCKRNGTYQFQETDAEFEAADEGWISSAVTEPLDSESDEVRLHETIFKWDGWSLAVPRPGKPLPQEGATQPEGNEYGVEVDFEPVPGSLPRLRFGHDYQIRARVVDLAGNGLPTDHDGASHATDPVRFGRYDPVPSPAVVPKRDLTEEKGESVGRVVIRSFNDEPPKDDSPTADKSERHVVPPRSTQMMAELHGMFDGSGGMQGDRATYDMIVQNQGSLDEEYPGNTFDVPYLPDAIAFGVVVRFRSLKAAPDEEDRTVRIPFDGRWPELRPFRIQIVERTSQAHEPKFYQGQRLLVIPLDKAETAEVWLSSYIDPESVDQMGMWDWTVQGVIEPGIEKSNVDRKKASKIRRDALNVHKLPSVQRQIPLNQQAVNRIQKLNAHVIKGMHWMVTPPHKVKLVHAVQQPLLTPQFQSLNASKQIGDTFARISDSVPVDGNSTAKIDVLAEWEEPLDKPAEPEPKVVEGSGHVCEIALEEGDNEAEISELMKLTQIRRKKLDKPGQIRRPQLQIETDTENDSDRHKLAPGVIKPGGQVMAELPHVGKKHEFGDTKYRRVKYKMKATTRYREYLPFSDEEIDSGDISITRSSDAVAVDILSSARPASPNLMYVVPTFGWDREEGDGQVVGRGGDADRRERGDQVISRRTGGGLRVYMQRPWYSSGAGELLGVVLFQPASSRMTIAANLVGAGGIPEKLKPYVTQWAQDPIYDAGTVRNQITPEAFTAAVEKEGDLTLDEVSGAKVQVAGHEVGYDPDRQLWYSDIEIDPDDAYFPFVRLALARYQPSSVKTDDADVKLSRVVLADFAQLAPDRVATYNMGRGKEDEVQITVRGGPGARTAAGRYNEIAATVETRDPKHDDDAAWRPLPDTTVSLERRKPHRGSIVYRGSVTLPEPRGSRPFRVVIKEFEQFRSETGQVAADTLTHQERIGRRLVYADTLEL